MDLVARLGAWAWPAQLPGSAPAGG